MVPALTGASAALAAGNCESLVAAGDSQRADARTRTGDPFITSEVLYQLSYVGGADMVAEVRGAGGGAGGREPRYSRTHGVTWS
jgi:hypothetical protein